MVKKTSDESEIRRCTECGVILTGHKSKTICDTMACYRSRANRQEMERVNPNRKNRTCMICGINIAERHGLAKTCGCEACERELKSRNKAATAERARKGIVCKKFRCICVTCGREFPAGHTTAKYCCSACKPKASTKQEQSAGFYKPGRHLPYRGMFDSGTFDPMYDSGRPLADYGICWRDVNFNPLG